MLIRSLISATRRRNTRFISTTISTQFAFIRLKRNWCKLKHAQTCLHCDKVAWLPASSAIKPFRQHYSHTTYGWSGGIAASHVNLGARWRWVVSFTPRLLYSKEIAPSNHLIGGWVGPSAGLFIKFGMNITTLEVTPPWFISHLGR
jgi:hypothetical protein